MDTSNYNIFPSLTPFLWLYPTMDPRTFEGKRAYNNEKPNSKDGGIVEEEMDDDVEDDERGSGSGGGGAGGDDEKKKGGSSGGGGGGVMYGRRGGGGGSPPCCQVEKCGADLSGAKKYHKRHKVCEIHAKAPVVLVAGLRQRFCQQCSRFHELVEFDEAKRSCRRRLAGHNERRRKSAAESYGEGSSRKGPFSGSQMKESQCRQADERGKFQITIPAAGNASYKRSQIR